MPEVRGWPAAGRAWRRARADRHWLDSLTAKWREGPAWSLALLVAQVAALWPVWVWYARRLSDGSDEPWGLVALAAVAVLLWSQRHSLRARPDVRLCIAAAAFTVIGAASGALLPALLRAAIGVSALALALAGTFERRRPLAPLWALLLLSLPLIASLQFYAGYPMRLFTASASQALLGLSGLEVARSGVALEWEGRTVLVDAPCSGVQMLWVGMFVNALLSFMQHAGAVRFALNTLATLGVVLAANAVRNSILFLKEAGIVTLPAWTHNGVGLAMFLVTLLAIARLVSWRGGAHRVGARESGLHATGPRESEFRESRPRESDPRDTGPRVADLRDTGPCDVGLGHIGPGDAASRLLRTLARLRPAPKAAASVGLLALPIMLLALATFVPSLGPVRSEAAGRAREEPAWPSEFQGKPLERVAATPLDRRFAAQLPGHLARFTDGERHLILRSLDAPTRLLHPAADCFKGLGYRVEQQRVRSDAQGGLWGCFQAQRDGRSLRVCERIEDRSGAAWTDVSSWYWAALLGRTRGPWLAITVASPP
jgi:exosortase